MKIRSRSFRGAVLALGATLGLAGPAAAQAMGDGFLFREPAISFAARGGFGHASAGSDIFSFTTEQLTLGRGDFSGPTFGGDVSFRLSQRLDLSLGASFTGRTARSEFRDWVEETEQGDVPIEQSTRFQRVPVTASIKAYLLPRGRSVGRFAWLPATYAPYVGVGGGGMWYRFHQAGDFVDANTFEIFTDELESSGWTRTAQGLAGVDVTLTPRFGITGEGRYVWANAPMSDSFERFDPIDLSGFSATLGIFLRF